jgi:membrane protein insertase Oxa1/YidC/SpoIIIJ
MFETYIYQPFFNILVGIYWVLGQISPEFADMGIAVILFSIVIRIILFPLTIAGERSEEEKRKIVDKVNEVKNTYAHDPVRMKSEIKLVMKSNLRSVLATTANLIIQAMIIFILYRIFTTGLEGADFHLLYGFMPNVTEVNLMFLGKYDLSHTNATLNLIQSVMIFVVEILIALRSPLALSRKDKALMQLILPVGSYIIFMFLPSGKKLFVITSLAFSALYNSLRLLQSLGRSLSERFTPKPPVPESDKPADSVTVTPPTPPSTPTG